MLITTRLYERAKVPVAKTDAKLQQELKDTQKQLNSILTKWKFGDQSIRTSEEFLNKFEPWINTQLQNQKELTDFLKKYSVDNLKKLKEIWQNTEQDYQEQIKELKKDKGSSLSEEDQEKVKDLNKKLEELKKKYSKQGVLLDGEQTDNNKLTKENEKLQGKIKELEERNEFLEEFAPKEAD